jgi:uncharacterized protein YbcI
MSEETSPAADIPAEVTRSLATVWKNYAAERPEDAETEISGDVVRCVLRGAVASFEEGMAAQPDGDGEFRRDLNTYRRDAAKAVTRVTHRRVLAFISKHDAKTDVATEVFILDDTRRRAPMGTEGAIVR